MLNHNATSLAFYQYLLDDTNKEIKYWQEQEESEDRTKQLAAFTKLYNEHQDNFDRVKLQAEKDGGNIIEQLGEVVEWFSFLLEKFGSVIPDETKELFVKIINAAKKVLAIFK